MSPDRLDTDDVTTPIAAGIDRTTSVTLPNGVAVDTVCGGTADQHVVFAPTASHAFLGYGANLQAPSEDRIERTIADLEALNFRWVKLDLGNPYKRVGGPPAPVGKTDAQMYQAVGATLRDSFGAVKPAFVAALHDKDINFVSTMYGAPKTYTVDFTLPDGTTGTRIHPDHIGDFATFYVAYLRSLNDVGILPDLSELQNEPNGAWNVKYTPAQFAQLVHGIADGLARNHGVVGNITASGTSTRVQNGVDFLEAIDATGRPALSAITLHNYYVIDQPNNDGIPPADDPAFDTLVSSAGDVPVISTEFGGTNLKTKQDDPDLLSVNPAEELKVALDLIRRGESAALVWNLYPNLDDGVLLRTWALLDENSVPTRAYWPFKALTPHVPVGAGVLAVTSSDVVATMTSLGYAAWRDGDRVIIALANPSARDLRVAIDVDGNDYVVNAVRSFDSAQVIERETRMGHKKCPITVTVPGDLGHDTGGRGAVLELTLKN